MDVTVADFVAALSEPAARQLGGRVAVGVLWHCPNGVFEVALAGQRWWRTATGRDEEWTWHCWGGGGATAAWRRCCVGGRVG